MQRSVSSAGSRSLTSRIWCLLADMGMKVEVERQMTYATADRLERCDVDRPTSMSRRGASPFDVPPVQLDAGPRHAQFYDVPNAAIGCARNEWRVFLQGAHAGANRYSI